MVGLTDPDGNNLYLLQKIRSLIAGRQSLGESGGQVLALRQAVPPLNRRGCLHEGPHGDSVTGPHVRPFRRSWRWRDGRGPLLASELHGRPQVGGSDMPHPTLWSL
jgi:hypothetical protein